MIFVILGLAAVAQGDRRPVDIEAFSKNSAIEIQTCIARRWGNSMSAEVMGPHVDLRVVGPLSRSNAITFTVDDLGDRRRVTVSYQHPWSAGGATKLFHKAERCWLPELR